MRNLKTWTCVLGCLFLLPAAFAQDSGQMRVRFQIFEIVGPFDDDISLDRKVWIGSRDEWREVDKSISLLDEGRFRLEEGTLKLNGDGVFWDDVSLFFGTEPNIELPRNRIRWLSAPDVYLGRKESSTIRIESNRKYEYFVHRESELFERRVEEVPEGMTISVFPKLEKDYAELKNLKIALQVVRRRESAQGTALPVGRPVTETREYKLPLRIDLRRPYGIRLRPDGGRHVFLICLDVTDVPQAVLDTIQREFPKCDVNEIKWNKKEEYYHIELDTAEGPDGKLRVELNGSLIDKEIEISLSEVPPQLKAVIERELDVKRIEDVMLMTTRNGKKIYKVDAETHKAKEIELDLAEDGAIVKKTF